jgi:hypothetical protein
MTVNKDKTRYKGFPEYEACSSILKRETELLEKIASIQMSVRNAVINRKWADFEMLFKSLGEYREIFESLEAERIGIFEGFSKKAGARDEHTGFYTLVSRLPGDERKRLTELYRHLKMTSYKIRLANDTLMGYLNEARATVAAFLEAAFPDRKGRIYSRRGKELQADMRSMVLDRCF